MVKRKIDDSFIVPRIEYLSEFDLVVEGNTKENVGVEVLSKILVMTHGSSQGSAVNVSRKITGSVLQDQSHLK